jgi:hypothetical protein
MVDDAVSIEPVSTVKFPDQQGKYREFPRFWRSLNRPTVKKAPVCMVFWG